MFTEKYLQTAVYLVHPKVPEYAQKKRFAFARNKHEGDGKPRRMLHTSYARATTSAGTK